MRRIYKPDRNGLGVVVCICDSCGEEEQYTYEGELDFKEWLSELRADGWTNKRDFDGWHYYCKNCSRQMKIKKNKK